mmetsp:Transcript_26170/g.83082  ORF Transcript_26170/g.83082 Transcript_26170/m.83082 type:complete len:209 (-) Transcript_26170:224-850(-)
MQFSPGHAQTECLALSTSHVVVDNYLQVLVSLNFGACRVVTRACLGVNIENFPVTLVLEEEACFIVRNDLEVGRRVGRACQCLPIVITKICRFGHELLLAVKVWLEVLRLESVREVYVPAHFLALPLVGAVSDKDDAGEFTVSDKLFTICESLEEREAREILGCGGKHFRCGLLLRVLFALHLFTGLEFLALQRLPAPAVAKLNKLPC